MKNKDRINQILERFPQVTILVVGDFFLDKYLIIDKKLAEVSIETGLEAHQVVDIRVSSGAAGTVTANLRALDVNVIALGITGDDGQGYELRNSLLRTGVDIRPLFQCPGRFTLTYMKPMLQEADGQYHELSRLDIKNHLPLPQEIEQGIITQLREFLPLVDGLVILDQVQEANCGVVTDQVRKEIAALARAYPEKHFIADSRTRIGLFKNIIIKTNLSEALTATESSFNKGASDIALAKACSAELFRRNQRPVIITIGEKGMIIHNLDGHQLIPGIPVTGLLDIVGAGDSATAGISAALNAGANLAEAALIGNLVASITVQQIGRTGTASRQEVLRRYNEFPQ